MGARMAQLLLQRYEQAFETVDFIELLEKGIQKVAPFEIQFLRQNIMRQVVNSLWPVMVAAIYFFGWRTFVIVLLSIITCVLTEWLFVRKKKPNKVSEAIFVNAGAKLAVVGSPVLEELRQLEELGVKVLVCGTCLKYFNVMDKLAVGSVTDMYTIIETLAHAERVIRP